MCKCSNSGLLVLHYIRSAQTMICVSKKIQKNLWLPPELSSKLDALVDRINSGVDAKGRTGQSEMAEIAIARLLDLSDDAVRRILAQRRIQWMAPLGRDPEPEIESAVDEAIQGRVPPPPAPLPKKSGTDSKPGSKRRA